MALYDARKASKLRWRVMGEISVEQQLLAEKWKLLVAGFIAQLLVPLLSAYRYEGEEVNMTLAKSEAKILHKMIADKVYNHEEIIRILTTRCKAQLIATFNHYNNEFGHPINKIDGVESLNNVLLVGMTNRKDLLDEALLRPGYLEVHVEINLPDESGRLQILQIHTNKMKENSFLDKSVDLKKLGTELS